MPKLMLKRKTTQESPPAAKAKAVTPATEKKTAVMDTVDRKTAVDFNNIHPAQIRQLQRTAGNQAIRRAVQRSAAQGMIVQRKMTVGPMGDKYEQEADAVAKQVVGNLNNPQPQTAQRQENDDELQMKPHLQRQTEEDEIQMKAASMMNGGDVSADIETDIQSAKGSGQSLDNNTQASMGQVFNADFSGVNIHTNEQADTLNRSLQARAFTTGNDIFFRSGEYSPNNGGGQELLAHELTHVVQQTGRIQRKPKQSTDDQIADMLSEFAPNFTVAPDEPIGYTATVAVQRGGEDYVAFAKKRMQSTIRNKVRRGLRKIPKIKNLFRKSKSTDEIRSRAAEKTLLSKGVEEPGQEAIDQVIEESKDVGHAWIKFSVYQNNGAFETFSFGFIPGEEPTHPTQSVQGVVRNPDIEYEGSGNTRFLEEKVSSKKFKNGLKKVNQLHNNPPAYTTSGYNCTTFTKEVAKAAGVNFPGGSRMMIPISTLGLFQKAYNPGKLYEQMGKDDDHYEVSHEEDLIDNGYEENDEGKLVSPEEILLEREATWEENDVRLLILRNDLTLTRCADADEIREEVGLTEVLLDMLTADTIRSMCSSGVFASRKIEALATAYEHFGMESPDGIEFYLWEPPAYERFKSPEWRLRRGGR